MSATTSASSNDEFEYEYDLRNPIDQWRLFRAYDNQAGLHDMSSAAVHVFRFILMRTIPWGKIDEVIGHRHFLGGVWDRDGKQVQCGIPIKKTALKAALKEVLDTGLVRRRPEFQGEGVHRKKVFRYELRPGAEFAVDVGLPRHLQPISNRLGS
jgi:hypothetical protein